MKRPELLDILDDLSELITIVPIAALEPLLAHCEQALRDAVPSRNGSVRDAHVLALAWSVEADVWDDRSRLCGNWRCDLVDAEPHAGACRSRRAIVVQAANRKIGRAHHGHPRLTKAATEEGR